MLFITHELSLNGAVISLLQQARRMRANGHDVTILTPALSGAAAALEGEFRETGADVVTRVFASQHDVAVACTIFTAGPLEDMVGRLPTVWWIHEGRVGVGHLIRQPPLMRMLGRVDKVIFPGRAVVEGVWAAMLGDLPPGRVAVIPNIIPPPPLTQAIARPPGRARVICVGSIYPRKRQVDLVRAVAMLPGAPVQCVLVGQHVRLDPPGEEIIRAHPDRYVLTGGLQPDALHAWYQSSDVFCLPSADECMPLTPIEAAWHGVPVVLSDLECHQDFWRHGVNALIHPVGDVQILAWCLNLLLESPSLRARLAGAGRAVTSRFTEPSVGPLFDAALRDAIATFGAASPLPR